MRVFGSSYKYKEEAAEQRKRMRAGQAHRMDGKEAPIKTEQSIHAISTPFGGINKKY